jgi:hypothetical protein
MQNAQLMSHVDTEIVTRAELQALPTPEATPTFKSIPHIERVDMLDLVLWQNQIRIEAEQFALRRDGSVLFGVLQLAYGETADGRAALGLRTANNKTMSIQLCAGLAVIVCDNLAFRGDMIALKRTSGLNLRVELAGAVLRFQEHLERLAGEVELLKGRMLADIEAKTLITTRSRGASCRCASDPKSLRPTSSRSSPNSRPATPGASTTLLPERQKRCP